MQTLYRHLLEAWRDWRSKRSDFSLLKTFLQSPDKRKESLDAASSDAKSFMLAIWGFAASDLQEARVQLRYLVSTPMWGDTPLPAPMQLHWLHLIWSALRETAGKGDGCPFTFMTDKGPVPVYVLQAEEKYPETPQNDLGESFVKAILEQSGTFVFSKTPPLV